MAEVQIEIEGFGNALASDESINLSQSLEGYQSHLKDLGIFNDTTIGKMVEEYEFSTAPIKGMQIVQKEYAERYADDNFSIADSIDRASSELGLDAAQKADMKKQFGTWKQTYDSQRDSVFSLQIEEVNAGIMQAYDEREIFDVTLLDEYMQELPAKHRISLFKAKKTAHANNDLIIEESVMAITKESQIPPEAAWDLVNQIHDPETKDKMGSSLLVSYGEALSAEGKGVSEIRSELQEYDAPVTKKAREKAIADFTKAQLDRESNMTKIAKDMLSHTQDDVEVVSRVPQQKITEIVETTKGEAPPIDASQVEARGEDYIEEHIKEVEKAIVPKISLGLGSPLDRGAGGEAAEKGEEPSSEAVREAAREIVDEQVEDIAHQRTEEPAEGQELTQEEDSEPESEEEESADPWWYEQYQAKVAERREEIQKEREAYEARLNRQAERTRKEAGVEVTQSDEQNAMDIPLERGMAQNELIGNMLQIIKDGEGRYITQDQLSLIRDDDLREQLIEMASIKDSFLVDSPLALDFIDSLRRDPNVSKDNLGNVIKGFVDNGFIKADTGDGLTNKYNFANNPNAESFMTYVGKLTNEIFPAGEGEVYNSNRERLQTTLETAAEEAITMNPDLLGKDYSKLQAQLQKFAVENLAKRSLQDLKAVTTYLSNGDIRKKISHLENSTVSTFLQDVQAGEYDVLLNYDALQKPEIRSLRNASREVVQDALARELTVYKDFATLKKDGTNFEMMQVMSNTSYLLAGGALEKSLAGSFGINPSDMKIMGKNWAFKDPGSDNLYFIATDTDVDKRGTVGWGMATADSDGVKNVAMFNDYVDPQLAYEIKSLESEINDPLFKKQHEEFLNPTVNKGGMYKDVPADASWRDQYGPQAGTSGGMWADAPEGSSHPDSYKKDTYQEKIDLHEEKTAELKGLISDIMAYRLELMGATATRLRKRL